MLNLKKYKMSRKLAYLKILFSKKERIIAATDAIDVVIPVIQKDLLILPLCLEGIKACVQHPVENTYIVAPNQPEIIDFCKKNALIFVEESSVLGLAPSDLNLQITFPNGDTANRSGWLFQQLIKLSGKVGTKENYLCIDADHILVQPHIFIAEDKRSVFYFSSENHQPYYNSIKKLLGDIPLAPLSYIAHKMIFNRKQVESLHEAIQQHTGKLWTDAILHYCDRTTISGFSEFETYGNFVQHKVLYPWKQHAMKYTKLAPYDTLVKRYGKKYRAITFPEYYNS